MDLPENGNRIDFASDLGVCRSRKRRYQVASKGDRKSTGRDDWNWGSISRET